MKRPRADDELTLLTEDGEITAICIAVNDDPAHPGGVRINVMARAPFDQGQQCWILDSDGTKIGARVESVATQTADTEVVLSAMLR
jgi:hypothetical protein